MLKLRVSLSLLQKAATRTPHLNFERGCTRTLLVVVCWMISSASSDWAWPKSLRLKESEALLHAAAASCAQHAALSLPRRCVNRYRQQAGSMQRTACCSTPGLLSWRPTSAGELSFVVASARPA